MCLNSLRSFTLFFATLVLAISLPASAVDDPLAEYRKKSYEELFHQLRTLMSQEGFHETLPYEYCLQLHPLVNRQPHILAYLRQTI